MNISKRKKYGLVSAGFFALIVGIFSNPNFSEAQQYPYVPIDALLGTQLNTLQTQTAIAAGAQTAKEVGQVPGIHPLSPSPGMAAGLAPTSHDFIARQISSEITGQLTSSMIKWIYSEFNGGPAFVSDPSRYFLDIADQVSGEFINGAGLNSLCQPFQTNIPDFGFNLRSLLDFRYSGRSEPQRSQWSCTLDGAISNAENYAAFTKPDGFAVGGWDGWFQIIQPQNNAYGALLAAETELGARISSAQNIELMKLNWGDGFFSLTDDGGNIITPGKTIANSLDQVLGSELRELETADSFDRILQALSSNLITSVLSSGGLKEASDTREKDSQGKFIVPTRSFVPLTPEKLTATEITQSNISLSWEASVGQVGSINYRVFRNGEAIVTTIETIFTDVGLLPDTEYIYQISAFNEAGESNLSSPVIARTKAL